MAADGGGKLDSEVEAKADEMVTSAEGQQKLAEAHANVLADAREQAEADQTVKAANANMDVEKARTKSRRRNNCYCFYRAPS